MVSVIGCTYKSSRTVLTRMKKRHQGVAHHAAKDSVHIHHSKAPKHVHAAHTYPRCCPKVNPHAATDPEWVDLLKHVRNGSYKEEQVLIHTPKARAHRGQLCCHWLALCAMEGCSVGHSHQEIGTAEVLTEGRLNEVCRSGTHDPHRWTVCIHTFFRSGHALRLCISPSRGCSSTLLAIMASHWIRCTRGAHRAYRMHRSWARLKVDCRSQPDDTNGQRPSPSSQRKTMMTTTPHLCSQRDDSDSGHHHQHCAASTTMTTAPSPASTTMTTTAPFCQLVDVDVGQHHHCNQWHINNDDDYHDPPTWLPRAAKTLITATTILLWLPPLPPPLPQCGLPSLRFRCMAPRQSGRGAYSTRAPTMTTTIH